MDMNKTTVTKPQTDAPRAIREMTEKSATQTKETYEKMSAATGEVTDLIKASCSTALKGMQEYNNKFMEFAHANTNGAFDFVQKLLSMKSPSEFSELLAQHARLQTTALTEQAEQLTEIAQKFAVAGAKPLQEGVAKTFNRAA